MELEVWGCDWGLPSVDPSCLAVMACCKFGDAPVTVVRTNNPWRSPTGNLPVLRHKENIFSGITEVCNYLREQNFGTDFELTVKQCSESLAFQALLEEKLLPAVLRIWWFDNKNFSEVTRPWFAKAVPFPQNLYYPVRKQSKCVKQFVQKMRIHTSITEDDADIKVFKDAKECLNLLSTKLGDKDFFMCTTPTSLDAMVYGYINPLLKAPFPYNPLLSHLNACDNLTMFCSRINQRYFQREIEESESVNKLNENKKQDDDSEFPNKYRNMAIAGLVALTAMLGFALTSGMVAIVETQKGAENICHDNSELDSEN